MRCGYCELSLRRELGTVVVARLNKSQLLDSLCVDQSTYS